MKKIKKLYIFDLDHTLFNARDFRQEIGLLLAGDREMISEDIWNYFKLHDIKLLNFLKEETKKYLFNNVLENLEKIKSEKIIITFGHIDFQKEKIKALDFDNIFDQVYLTDENKIHFLEDFALKNKDKEIILINDNYNKRFSENAEIALKIPQIKILEVDNYKKEKRKTIDDVFKIIFDKFEK